MAFDTVSRVVREDADPMGDFLDACGASGPLLLDLATRGGPEVQRRAFGQPFLLVGCHPDADLPLDHGPVSRRHAYLQLVGGRLFCIDLGSRAGTLLPGGSGGVGWVDRSAAFRIGPVTLRLRGGDTEGTRAAPGPSPLSGSYARRTHLPDAVLEISGEGLGRASWPIGHALVLIGSSPLCKVRLLDPGAEPFSCSLIRTPAGVWMVDLLATEGVLVNGTRRRWARLEDGDELRVGGYTLRLRCDGGSPGPTARQVACLAEGEGARLALEPAPGLLGELAVYPHRPHIGEVPAPDHARAEMSVPADLLSRLERVERSQERMCGQFQDAMMMISQMLGTMHRDHMSVVRDELEQIRRLTEEIHALRAAAPSLAGPARPAGVPAARAMASPVSASAVPLDESSIPGFSGRRGSDARPDGLQSPPGTEEGRARRDPLDFHAIADERLAAYEHERRRHWRKLLRVMLNP